MDQSLEVLRLASQQNDSNSGGLRSGLHRLSLYLDLESKNGDAATDKFKQQVRDLLSNASLTIVEKRLSARFLGRVCGAASAAPEVSVIPVSTIDRAIQALRGHRSKSVANEFEGAMAEMIAHVDRLKRNLQEKRNLGIDSAEERIQDASRVLDIESHEFGKLNILWSESKERLSYLHKETEAAERNSKQFHKYMNNTVEAGMPERPQ